MFILLFHTAIFDNVPFNRPSRDNHYIREDHSFVPLSEELLFWRRATAAWQMSESGQKGAIAGLAPYACYVAVSRPSVYEYATEFAAFLGCPGCPGSGSF